MGAGDIEGGRESSGGGGAGGSMLRNPAYAGRAGFGKTGCFGGGGESRDRFISVRGRDLETARIMNARIRTGSRSRCPRWWAKPRSHWRKSSWSGKSITRRGGRSNRVYCKGCWCAKSAATRCIARRLRPPNQSPYYIPFRGSVAFAFGKGGFSKNGRFERNTGWVCPDRNVSGFGRTRACLRGI